MFNLKKTIDEQIKISEQQNKIIKEQADKLDGKTKLIDELEQKCDNLSAELNKVKVAVSDLEQYGRRNSLRFSKLGFDPKLPENELIKKTPLTSTIECYQTALCCPSQTSIDTILLVN